MSKILYFGITVATVFLASCGQQANTPKAEAIVISFSESQRVQAVNIIQHLPISELDRLVSEASKQPDPENFLISQVLAKGNSINTQAFNGLLNPAESQLCNTNAYNCSQTLIIASGSETVARNNFSDGEYDGRQDAFRHSYWNAVMTAEINETWATQFANAHESDQPNTLSTQMDYHNNQVGRNIGRSYRVGQRAYIEANIRNAVLDGRTMRVCNNSLRYTSASPSC